MILKCHLRCQKRADLKELVWLPKKRDVEQPSPFLRKSEWEKRSVLVEVYAVL